MSNSALVGTAGTYFVMAQLAARNFHASCTFGNAPYIDILVSSHDGQHTASIQVKTASFAERWRGRGSNKTLDHYEWYLGHKVASVPQGSRLFYAFVDLRIAYWQEGHQPSAVQPEIFIIPLAAVAQWYHEHIKPSGMSRLWGTPSFLKPYRAAYHLLQKAVAP